MLSKLYKTEPFKHQEECTFRGDDRNAFGIFFEQGLGKTKSVIDTSAHLFYEKGDIDALFILAPNGVHTNWLMREVPAHLSDLIDYDALEYVSTKTGTKKFKAGWSNLIQSKDMAILAMNVEALSSSKKAFDHAQEFLSKRKCMLALDESSRIKTPSSTRTKRVIKLGKLAPYRRPMSGTPVTQSPLDLFTQFNFMDPSFLGFKSFYTFKHNYAQWEKKVGKQGAKKWNYETLVKYVRLDDLKRRIAPHCIRRTKEECLDLPRKIYQTVMLDLSPAQKSFYSRLKEHDILEFEDFEILTSNHLTKLMRLQQVTGGFIPTDDPERASIPIPGPNPKLTYLLEATEDEYQGKAIIWARFKYEINMIRKALQAQYGRKAVVELHGDISVADRQANIDRFQDDPSCRFVIGQQQCGIGYTMHAAETVFYYSNSFSYEQRYQSEDRAHRIGLTHPVVYVDLMMRETVDARVKYVLNKTCKVAADINGDNERTICR